MENKSYHIRHMMKDDILNVFEVERKSFPFPFGETLIGNIYFGAPELCFVLEYHENIIGFLLAGYTALPKQAHILSLAILDDYRGIGLGRSLIEFFIEKTEVLGYSSIKLEVAVENDIAIKLYEELGFTTISRIRKYYQDDSDAFSMVRNN